MCLKRAVVTAHSGMTQCRYACNTANHHHLGMLPRPFQHDGVQPGMLRHFGHPFGNCLSQEAGLFLVFFVALTTFTAATFFWSMRGLGVSEVTPCTSHGKVPRSLPRYNHIKNEVPFLSSPFSSAGLRWLLASSARQMSSARQLPACAKQCFSTQSVCLCTRYMLEGSCGCYRKVPYIVGAKKILMRLRPMLPSLVAPSPQTLQP